jgi:hypothetical protein
MQRGLKRSEYREGDMKVIGSREWRGFFEEGATPQAQLQILTLFVWITALILLMFSAKFWRRGQYSDARILLPALHLLPWYVATSERKRLSRLTTKRENDLEFRSLLEHTIIRLLWVGYVVLAIVEYSLY